jgi:hypothetical protein
VALVIMLFVATIWAAVILMTVILPTILKAMKTPFRKALYQHYITPPEQVFPRFRLGAMIFFWGLIFIYGGSQLLTPSFTQELVILLALILIGIGFLMALMAQVRMLIGRILRFIVS